MQRGKEVFRLTPVLSWEGGTSLWGVMSYTYVAEWRFVDGLSNSTPPSITPSSFSIPEAGRKLTLPLTLGIERGTLPVVGAFCLSGHFQIPMCGLS